MTRKPFVLRPPSTALRRGYRLENSLTRSLVRYLALRKARTAPSTDPTKQAARASSTPGPKPRTSAKTNPAPKVRRKGGTKTTVVRTKTATKARKACEVWAGSQPRNQWMALRDTSPQRRSA